MKTQKRKSPEKKPVRQEPGPIFRVGSLVVDAVAARPGLTAGVVVFAIVFGIVSANALWYQPPGGHPSPFLRTRDTRDHHLLVGFERQEEPENVTTFRIERQGSNEQAAAPAGQDAVAQLLTATSSGLVHDVQAELNRLGYYPSQADGVSGPMTAQAIAAFQKKEGLPETGEASDSLLALLRKTGAPEAAAVPVPVPAAAPAAVASSAPAQPMPVAIPVPRPSFASAPKTAVDPVAEAIRNSGRIAVPVSAPATTGSVADADLVMAIQRGLSKYSYSNISVDGVAGSATREAIRNFERAYRLPETGEPNRLVLKKLKEIGAL